MLNNLIDRIRLPFRKDRELISSLYDIIGIYPHKLAYYKLALMHKSLGHRSTAEDIVEDKKWTKKGILKKDKGDRRNGKGYGAKAKGDGRNGKGSSKLGRKLSNERLEFLGDAILDAVVGDIVYRQYPGKPEGFLTNTRSKLVQRETLGKLAQQIGLSRLILSSGRSVSHNSYIDGNAFEALVGALYLDRGYEACYKFWEERILGRYINIDKMAYKEVNFKSKLIEWTQKNRIQMEFRLEDQSKDTNGSPTFKYTVILENVEGETGDGFSKKEAQQHASEKTLKRLKTDKPFLDSVFAAKTERTKMDEDMVQTVPDVERPVANDFIIEDKDTETALLDEATDNVTVSDEGAKEKTANNAPEKETSREDIIAAAEAAAYSAEVE